MVNQNIINGFLQGKKLFIDGDDLKTLFKILSVVNNHLPTGERVNVQPVGTSFIVSL